MSLGPLLCNYCTRLSRGHHGLTCDAYPDSIPPEFSYGHSQHFDPAKGDHDIQFEEADGLTAGEMARVARLREAHVRRQTDSQAVRKPSGADEQGGQCLGRPKP